MIKRKHRQQTQSPLPLAISRTEKEKNGAGSEVRFQNPPNVVNEFPMIPKRSMRFTPTIFLSYDLAEIRREKTKKKQKGVRKKKQNKPQIGMIDSIWPRFCDANETKRSI
jgi:hypothetical protein